MDNCVFCQIARKEIPAKIRFEDDEILAFDDVHPSAPVHILVIPKEHIASLHEATAGDREIIVKAFWRAKQLADELKLFEPGFRITINNGDWAGQVVHHIHFHLMAGAKDS